MLKKFKKTPSLSRKRSACSALTPLSDNHSLKRSRNASTNTLDQIGNSLRILAESFTVTEGPSTLEAPSTPIRRTNAV
jgi:hypothetical protein